MNSVRYEDDPTYIQENHFSVERSNNELYVFYRGNLIYKKWFNSCGDKIESAIIDEIFGKINLPNES